MNTQQNLKVLFASLSNLPGIDQASGDIVPLPGNNGTMTEHLFVNLVLPLPTEDDPVKVLAAFRADAQKAFQAIARSMTPFLYASAVVSLYAVPRDGTNIRLYRTRVLAEELERVQDQNFTVCCQGEESHHPSVRALLSSKT